MNNQSADHFNIRVYGLIINNKQEVLLTDEYQLDTKMTKFPGGGLEFGEGTIDCLKRELKEEMNQEINNIKHFYTTDFFQQGYFKNRAQIISIYYTAELQGRTMFRVSESQFDFSEMKNGNMSFRWKSIKDLKVEDLTFPIDKHIVNMIKEFNMLDT